MGKIDYENMTDKEFHKMFKKFDKKIKKFLEKEDFYNKYIAYFIAEEYREDLLPKVSLDVMITTALQSVEVVNTSKKKIKNHLKREHNLKIIDEKNLKFKEL